MPRIAQICPECPDLPRIAQNCPECPNLPRFAQYAQICPELSRIAQICPKCPNLPRIGIDQKIQKGIFFWDALYIDTLFYLFLKKGTNWLKMHKKWNGKSNKAPEKRIDYCALLPPYLLPFSSTSQSLQSLSGLLSSLKPPASHPTSLPLNQKTHNHLTSQPLHLPSLLTVFEFRRILFFTFWHFEWEEN